MAYSTILNQAPEALRAPIAREVAMAFLAGSARANTLPGLRHDTRGPATGGRRSFAELATGLTMQALK